MAIECIAVRMAAGGTLHEHISDIQWRDDSNGNVQASSRAEMVIFVDRYPNQAYCRGRSGVPAFLKVRVSMNGTKYVQTEADGIPSNNLLELPRF